MRVETPVCWWWLSFADGSLPKGSQFLGVAVVRGRDLGEAATRAHELDINPGGEVVGIPIAPVAGAPPPPAGLRDNLVRDKAEIARLDDEWIVALRAHREKQS